MRAGESGIPEPIGSWLCIDTGEHDGRFNMDYDLRLVEDYKSNRVPILRFYTWKPFCISLGKNQNESDIDTERAASDGIDVVKRPTGGKAVLHAEELTYSVVMETGGRSVRETYNAISGALASGLRRLGADLELSRSSADFRKLFHDPSAIPCFSTSAVYEVESGGRKIIGSAQHRFGDVLLQHGSILIGDFHKRIVDYLKIDENLRRKTREDLDNHTVALAHLISGNIESDNLKSALKSGFEEVFRIRVSDLAAAELISHRLTLAAS